MIFHLRAYIVLKILFELFFENKKNGGMFFQGGKCRRMGMQFFSCGVGGVKVVANCVQNKPKWNVVGKGPYLEEKD